MTYQEAITHLTNELPFLNTDHRIQLTTCLDILENGTETDKIESSEDLVNLYTVAAWSNCELIRDAINIVYATVNPTASFPKIGL